TPNPAHLARNLTSWLPGGARESTKTARNDPLLSSLEPNGIRSSGKLDKTWTSFKASNSALSHYHHFRVSSMRMTSPLNKVKRSRSENNHHDPN
ncbi:hypothetical protein RRG08_001132, partial [Elysia crispata]